MAEEAKSAEEVAHILNCHPATLLRWAREGKVPAKKFGHRWIFLESLLVEWRDAALRSNCHAVTSRGDLQ